MYKKKFNPQKRHHLPTNDRDAQIIAHVVSVFGFENNDEPVPTNDEVAAFFVRFGEILAIQHRTVFKQSIPKHMKWITFHHTDDAIRAINHFELRHRLHPDVPPLPPLPSRLSVPSSSAEIEAESKLPPWADRFGVGKMSAEAMRFFNIPPELESLVDNELHPTEDRRKPDNGWDSIGSRKRQRSKSRDTHSGGGEEVEKKPPTGPRARGTKLPRITSVNSHDNSAAGPSSSSSWNVTPHRLNSLNTNESELSPAVTLVGDWGFPPFEATSSASRRPSSSSLHPMEATLDKPDRDQSYASPNVKTESTEPSLSMQGLPTRPMPPPSPISRNPSMTTLVASPMRPVPAPSTATLSPSQTASIVSLLSDPSLGEALRLIGLGSSEPFRLTKGGPEPTTTEKSALIQRTVTTPPPPQRSTPPRARSRSQSRSRSSRFDVETHRNFQSLRDELTVERTATKAAEYKKDKALADVKVLEDKLQVAEMEVDKLQKVIKKLKGNLAEERRYADEQRDRRKLAEEAYHHEASRSAALSVPAPGKVTVDSLSKGKTEDQLGSVGTSTNSAPNQPPDDVIRLEREVVNLSASRVSIRDALQEEQMAKWRLEADVERLVEENRKLQDQLDARSKHDAYLVPELVRAFAAVEKLASGAHHSML